MFASHYDESIRNELTKCLRVFPHDQNTSGFFITIITKIKDFDYNGGDGTDVPVQQVLVSIPQEPREEEKKQPVNQAKLPLDIQKKSRLCSFEFTRCDPEDPDIQYLKAYYGLGEDFPVD